MGFCGMKNFNLIKESINILGVHISYNKKIQDDFNFTKTIKNLCNVVKTYATAYEKTHFKRKKKNF